MPTDPTQHDGVWWVQQDDGTWIRWDETSGKWVDHKASVAGSATGPAPSVMTVQSGPQKPRSKTPLYAIVGVIVLGIVAIGVYAVTSGGSNDGNEQSALGGPQGAAPAQAALDPIACEHKGSGKAYEVGPGKALDSLGKVPWDTLAAGDTVLINYRPEPYREKFLLRGQGTKEQPITVCGVAGPGGELPIIDGQNAVGAAGLAYPFSGNGEPRGLITVTLGAADQWGYKPQYLVIQGLHIRNAFNENSFTASNGKASKYADNAAGIFIERGEHIIVRGVVLEGNGNGFFVASGDSEEVLSRDILLERSRIYGNGTVKVAADRHHNIYTEANGMVFQFNDIGPLREGSGGAALKDRSAGTVVRYNRIEGGSRTLDLVDAQESSTLLKDLPEYRTTLVYGNIMIAGPVGSSNMIHYGGDSGVPEITRQGTLYFYNNTVVVRANQTGANARYRTALFDATSSRETIDARNNVIDVRPAVQGSPATELTWMRDEGNLKLGVNWVSPDIQQWRDDKAPAGGGITGLEKVIGKGSTDPVFTNEADGDYSLASGSKAAGVAEALHEVPVRLKATVDFEYVHPAAGRPRPAGTDLGAYSGGGGAAPSGASAASSPGKGRPTVSGSAKADGWTGPLQYLGKGPNGYDNGQKSACTGAKAGSPSVICVRAGAGSGGTGTGAAPFGSINAALAAAAPKDVIQVAGGSYPENVAIGKELSALVQTEITLLGGFSPDFTTRNASQFRSVIDGKGAGPAVQLHLQSAGKTVLDGFRVTGGKGLGTNSENGNGRGGGVFVEILGNGEVLISHNEIYGNQTSKFEDEQRGGGINADGQTYDGSKPVIRIEDNVIHNNQAGRGAGINVTGRQATILRNVVEANRAHSDHGGGIYVSTEGGAEVADNVVRGNEIGVTVKYGYGGGIIIAAAPAELHGNVITGNYAPTNGSGVFWDEGAKGTMREDLIFANACPSDDARSGTAVYVDGGAAPSVVTLDHVTIAEHNCPFAAPAGAAIQVENLSKVTVKDSILWNNSREFQTLDKGTFTIQNSITTVSGSGNKSTDPQFVDPASGDFHLKPGSSAIGAASNKTNAGAYPK
ncbi:MAG: right-handed parallel beta-helix repeat-containing protein [Acidimicrobiales bacterium]